MKKTTILALFAFMLVSCGEDEVTEEEELPAIPVNIQITEYKDSEAFEKVVSELEKRGIRATII